MRHGLVLAGLLLVFSIVLASAVTLAELGYGPGDWLRYRYSFSAGGAKCVYIIKVTVRDVQGTVVKYDAGIEKLESGDSTLCSSLSGLLVLGLAFSSATSKDVSSRGPETGDFFISPRYSGDYTTSSGYRVSYKDGVLVKIEGESTAGIVATLSAELIDTSIGWLKQGIGQTPFTQQLLIITATVAIAAIGIAVYFIARRRTMETQPLQPQQQPSVPGN